MGSKNIPIGKYVFSASNIATLFNCGFHTTLELYEKFRNPKADYPQEISDASRESMDFGSHFEFPVAKYAAKKLGIKRIKACKTLAFWADDMPYFICHPDYLVIGTDSKGRRAAIECKCVQPFAEGWGEEGTDEIPLNYFIQCQCYFACEVPVDVVYVACMRGNRVYVYEILPDEQIIAEIRRRVAKTYIDFSNGIVPETENYKEAVRFYGQSARLEDEGIGANDEVVATYEELKKVHEMKTLAEKKEEQLKTDLIKALGDSSAFVVTEDKKIKRICYWSDKAQKPSFSREAFEKDHAEIDIDKYYISNKQRVFNISYPRAKKENANG